MFYVSFILYNLYIWNKVCICKKMWRCLQWVLYKMHIFWVLILYKSSKSSTTQRKIVWSEAVALRCSAKKGVLRNFVKFSGKQLYQSLFFNKVADIRPASDIRPQVAASVLSWYICSKLDIFAQNLIHIRFAGSKKLWK